MTTAAKHPQGTVYMLHFDRPYKHAKHYTGWASDLAARLAEHAAGRGARLTQVVKEAGISWQLARTWPGTRDTERVIKNRRDAPRICPFCTDHPKPATGRRATPRPVDLAPRREAAAFLAGVRSAERWAGPVLAAGRLAEARQMLTVDYTAADRQDAERQRGFTAQLASMIRAATPPVPSPHEAGDRTPTRKESELRDHQETAASLRAKAAAGGVTAEEASALQAKADKISAKTPAPARTPEPTPARPGVAPLTGMTLSEALSGMGRTAGYVKQAAPASPPARQALPGGCDHEAGE